MVCNDYFIISIIRIERCGMIILILCELFVGFGRIPIDEQSKCIWILYFPAMVGSLKAVLIFESIEEILQALPYGIVGIISFLSFPQGEDHYFGCHFRGRQQAELGLCSFFVGLKSHFCRASLPISIGICQMLTSLLIMEFCPEGYSLQRNAEAFLSGTQDASAAHGTHGCRVADFG